MCDRPLPQQALCDELSMLHTLLPLSAVPIWWRAFWIVMGSEWTTGIDVLRMNKFLLLVRRMVYSILTFPRDIQAWEAQSVLDAISVLEEYPFEVSGNLQKVPVGLRLHALDVWIDELDKAGILDEASSGNTEALAFVNSICGIIENLQKCPCKAVQRKAESCCMDERLSWKRNLSDTKMAQYDDLSNNDGYDDRIISTKILQSNSHPLDIEDSQDDTWNGFDN